MRSFHRDAEIATGLDLLLVGAIATIIGGYIKSLSSAPTVSYTESHTLTLLHAAAAIPSAIGSTVFVAGILAGIGGPLVFWIGWPVYRRLT